MTCKINADTTDGLKIVSDTSGEIEIQDNGTTRLTIGDTIDIQGTELVLDADADTSIHASTDDQIDFKLGGSDRIIFTSSGISTTNSSGIAIGTEDDNAAIFEISGAASGDEGGEIRLDTAADHDGTYQFYRIDVNQDDLRIGREGNTDVTFNSDGKVGIGTTTPTATLQVNAAQVSSTVDLLNLRDASAGSEFKFTAFGDAAYGTSQRIDFTGAYLQIRNGTDQALRIDSAERILIGPMTGNNVNGSSSKAQISYVKNSEFGLHIRPSDNNTGGGQPVLFQNQAGTSIGSIGATASNVSYNTSSDYRLKENVSYSWDATSRLKQLKPARFNWIIDDTNTAIDGFMAHEVTSIVPDAVSGTKDATTTQLKIVKDADGNFIASDIEQANWTAGKEDGTYPNDSTWTASEAIPEYQSIDHSKLVPLLVKTIQELEARITALES